MNVQTFSEWELRQGKKVIQTKNSNWFEASPHIYQAFPFHWVISPSEKELKELICNHKIFALRYSAPIESPFGKISYHIMQKPPYGIENLHKRTQRYLKKGLKQFIVEPTSFSELAVNGWKLAQDTLERQGRTKAMSQKEWENLCVSAEGLPGFEGWAAKIDGELAACLITTIIDDTGYFLNLNTKSIYLDKNVDEVIVYTVTSELFKNKGINSIFYTFQSLDAEESVDTFKFRMGARPKPVRQRIIFHPMLSPFINTLSHKLIAYMVKNFSKNQMLPKTEGMVRFYLEGKLPKTKQNIPDCLEYYKD
jgi:hypothetical protein